MDDILPATPGHTIGPFFHDALGWAAAGGGDGGGYGGSGEIVIEGSVEDGTGERLPAWLIEAWVPQAVDADAQAGSAAPGLRRLADDASGRFALHVPAPPPGQPAAFVTLFGVGLTSHRFTAVFVDAAGAPLLDAAPAGRRPTLVAERVADGRYRWTIRTHGERETVFFDYR